MRDELRQSFALLPRCSNLWIRITKPGEGSIKKFFRRRGVPAAALSIKGPAENQLCRTIMVARHSPEPMVNKRGLPHTGPGNNGNGIYLLVCPGSIQETNVLLSSKDAARRNG